MTEKQKWLIGCGVGFLLLIGIGCLAMFAGGVWVFNQAVEELDGIVIDTGVDIKPTEPVYEDVVDVVPDILAGLEYETLETLQTIIVPENVPADIGRRLLGLENVPETYPDLDAPHKVGETMQFWITDTDTGENFQTSATLQYVTDHAYFWIGTGVNYSVPSLERVAEEFENHIYPTTRNFFGSEWFPGIDGDPHVYIVYVGGAGDSILGYFSTADETHPDVHEYSNAHEMFVLNSDNLPLRKNGMSETLAHEFQHMIHWSQDRNESSWMNEGFSEVAALIAGYGDSGFTPYYLVDPDLQLNDWPNDPDDPYATLPHYGAAFLYLTYFLERIGEEGTQALVANPENGLGSVDQALQELESYDLIRDSLLTADDLMVDWAITNFLMDGDVADGRFTYDLLAKPQRTYEYELVDDCSQEPLELVVHQYGVDYLSVICSGEHTLYFDGAELTALLPADAYSGSYSFWSNKGDESNMTLTRTFDLTDHSGSLTLSYWTWYDIEEGWDYIYLVASTDGGQTWEILQTPSSTDDDPAGNSFGWGYTGFSGGEKVWVEETVDISQYAGQEVLFRFEYITDAAVNGEGLLLDDVSIPEIDYFADFEDDDGGWEGAGFVRVANVLPQTFELAVISYGNTIEVEYLTLNEGNTLEYSFVIDNSEVDEVVLVVIGTTRYTRQLAAYTISFDR